MQIECRDALQIIERFDGENTFFYLDPPYFNSNCGHYKGFLESDFEKLLNVLTTIKGKFLLSSYPSSLLENFIRENGWNKNEKQQPFSVNHASKNKKTEVMVFNYPVPEIVDVITKTVPDGLQEFLGKSKPVVMKNVALFAKDYSDDGLQRDEELLCFGANDFIYDQMPSLPTHNRVL